MTPQRKTALVLQFASIVISVIAGQRHTLNDGMFWAWIVLGTLAGGIFIAKTLVEWPYTTVPARCLPGAKMKIPGYINYINVNVASKPRTFTLPELFDGGGDGLMNIEVVYNYRLDGIDALRTWTTVVDTDDVEAKISNEVRVATGHVVSSSHSRALGSAEYQEVADAIYARCLSTELLNQGLGGYCVVLLSVKVVKVAPPAIIAASKLFVDRLFDGFLGWWQSLKL